MEQASDSPEQQQTSGWASALHPDLGNEIVRRWNAHSSMLAALQRIRTQVNYEIDTGGGLFSDADLEAIDNAIRKATGGTP